MQADLAFRAPPKGCYGTCGSGGGGGTSAATGSGRAGTVGTAGSAGAAGKLGAGSEGAEGGSETAVVTVLTGSGGGEGADTPPGAVSEPALVPPAEREPETGSTGAAADVAGASSRGGLPGFEMSTNAPPREAPTWRAPGVGEPLPTLANRPAAREPTRLVTRTRVEEA